MIASLCLIASGGALGAMARFLTVSIAQRILGVTFPYGTFLVNALGSLMIGLFMGFFFERIAEAQAWRLFVVVGFLGAYTTFSSFAWETWSLYQDGAWFAALVNMLANNLITLLMVILGTHFARYWGNI